MNKDTRDPLEQQMDAHDVLAEIRKARGEDPEMSADWHMGYFAPIKTSKATYIGPCAKCGQAVTSDNCNHVDDHFQICGKCEV